MSKEDTSRRFTRFGVFAAALTASALGAAVLSAVAMRIGRGEVAAASSRVALALALVMVIYVLPRLAHGIGLEALRPDAASRLPAPGWVFLGLTGGVALLALMTGNNLLYLVLAVLLATLVVSAAAASLSLSATGVKLRFPDHIFADEPARFEIVASNRKRLLPSFSLTVTAIEGIRSSAMKTAPMLGRLAHFALIPARAQARARIERRFARRGVYTVSGFRVTTRFPFGFIEWARRVEANGEIVVYPQPQPLDDFYHLLPLTEGRTESAARGSGSDLYAIRQYLRTDHMRHVDWKATAKTSRLMVREFTREDDWRVLIALDEAAGAVEEDRFERAVTLAASLATHFLEEGAEVRLVTGRWDDGYGSGLDHRYGLLRQLAQLAPREDGADLLARLPGLASDDEFKILITAAGRGTIPSRVWRASHVIFFDEI